MKMNLFNNKFYNHPSEEKSGCLRSKELLISLKSIRLETMVKSGEAIWIKPRNITKLSKAVYLKSDISSRDSPKTFPKLLRKSAKRRPSSQEAFKA